MTRVGLTRGALRAVLLTPPEVRPVPVLYTHLSPDEGEATLKLPGVPVCALICIEADWDRDLSPWPASRAFRGGADFGGGGEAHLREICRLIPDAEASLRFAPAVRCIGGYSLDGLFALWALYQTDLFSRAASVSGSLWYDGLLSRLSSGRPPATPERVYFSLGDREGQTKNARLARVGPCTEQAVHLLAGSGADTVFETNPGGHFSDVPERMARALRWLLR